MIFVKRDNEYILFSCQRFGNPFYGGQNLKCEDWDCNQCNNNIGKVFTIGLAQLKLTYINNRRVLFLNLESEDL